MVCAFQCRHGQPLQLNMHHNRSTVKMSLFKSMSLEMLITNRSISNSSHLSLLYSGIFRCFDVEVYQWAVMVRDARDHSYLAQSTSRIANDKLNSENCFKCWESGWLSGYLSSLPPLLAGVQLWPRLACGLSFSRSQPDSTVFLLVLRFSSLIKIDSQLINI